MKNLIYKYLYKKLSKISSINDQILISNILPIQLKAETTYETFWMNLILLQIIADKTYKT